MARAIIEHSREVWLAADHSKFNRPAMVELARLDEIDMLFTDAAPPAPFPDAARRRRRAAASPARSRHDDTAPPPGPRPGHLELAQHRLRRATASIVADGAARVPPDLSRSPAGSSTTRARSGARSSRPRARRSRKAGLGAADIAAHRHHQPARDDDASGTARTGEPIGNAIVWQDRRTAPTCDALRARGLEPLVPRADRARHRRLLLGHQARLAARPRRRRARRGERGELAFGTVDSWLMWQLTGGATAATRSARSTPPTSSNASRTLLFDVPRGEWERRAARRCSTCRAKCCPKCIRRATSFGHTDADLFGAPIADRRRRRRPAERAVRPGVLPPGPGEEHLRHRLLHADEHRRALRGLGQRPDRDQRGAGRRRGRSSRSKAASSSAAPSSSGCATA